MSCISRELHRSLVHARAKPVDHGFTRYRVCVQYLGHKFNGSSGKTTAARGRGGGRGRVNSTNANTTVEDCLINAAKLFVGDKGEFRNLAISSRTDAGVHAYGNCFQVDLPNKGSRHAAEDGSSSSSIEGAYDAAQVCRGFNYFLKHNDPSPGLAVTGAERLEGKEPFDCRASSTGRTYVYRIMMPPAIKSSNSCSSGSKNESTFSANLFADSFSWSLSHRLDVQRMQECARLLVGEKDFSCFRSAGCQSKSPYRLVSQLDIRAICTLTHGNGGSSSLGTSGVTSNVFIDDKELLFLGDDDLIVITITANAFLLKMVRNIVGALVDVGLDRLSAADVARALESGDRAALRRSEPAPARGLFLYKVHYDQGDAY